MDVMSNEQIISDFEALFATSSDEETETVANEVEDSVESENVEEKSETDVEESLEEDSSDESSKDDKSEESSEKEDTKAQSQKDYAWAQQRKQLRARENLIKDLGKIIGMEGSSVDDIADKVKDALLEKQSKDSGLSVDILKRIERAEAIIQDNEKLKLERDVQNTFADLIEKYELSKEQVDDFTQYLIDNDINPMDGKQVDVEAVYLKLHHNDMLQIAVEKALEKERIRQEKVVNKASSKTGGNGSLSKSDEKISSIKALDDLFNGMDL